MLNDGDAKRGFGNPMSVAHFEPVDQNIYENRWKKYACHEVLAGLTFCCSRGYMNEQQQQINSKLKGQEMIRYRSVLIYLSFFFFFLGKMNKWVPKIQNSLLK